MFGLGKKEKKDSAFHIVSPATGKLINLENVPDQVFSAKMMGEGFAIEPEDGLILAPISGTVESVFPTGHAIGIKSKEGVECIVHIGLDTVSLEGKGFVPQVRQGDTVQAGQAVVKADLETIRSAGLPTITMTVFTAGFNKKVTVKDVTAKAGQILI